MTLDATQARDPEARCGNCPCFRYIGEPYTHGDCQRQPPVVLTTQGLSVYPIVKPDDWCSQHPLNKIAYEKFIMDWRDTQHEARRLRWEIEAQEAYSKNVDITSEGTTA